MANKKSAIKALKQGEKRRLMNQSRKSTVKSAFKEIKDALKAGESKEELMSLLSKASSEAQRAAGKKVLHKNTASRKISRITKAINKNFSK